MKFTIIFRESGYYTYKVFTQFQRQDSELPPIDKNCYVKPAPTPTPTPTPTTTPTATPITTQTPEEEAPAFDLLCDETHRILWRILYEQMNIIDVDCHINDFYIHLPACLPDKAFTNHSNIVSKNFPRSFGVMTI
ncbi:MAG: hypothetical protein SVJ22_11190 [Halobacteriota archaeon]|nr:hypothetical protein [Halobacteriota archaeon]